MPPRFTRSIDINTGIEVPVQFTPAEEAAADTAAAAEAQAKKDAALEVPPAKKLAAFLNANPDVKALIEDNK